MLRINEGLALHVCASGWWWRWTHVCAEVESS